MTTAEQWAEILREATQRAVKESGRAVPGATLRQWVQKVAQEWKLSYPPEENPTIKFAEFLEQHSSVVAIRRQPSADLFVAPVDRPDLLVKVPVARQPLPGLRQDIFDGFTKIRSNRRAWYDRATDAVEWHPVDAAIDATRFVRLPPLSIDEARAVRKRFSAEQDSADARKRLEEAANNPAGLGAFTEAVRDCGLGAEWHQFRIKALVDRISEWAKANGMQWQDAWLTASSRGDPSKTLEEVQETREWRHAFLTFAQTVDQEDLRRISVPLDIVLKALQQRR